MQTHDAMSMQSCAALACTDSVQPASLLHHFVQFRGCLEYIGVTQPTSGSPEPALPHARLRDEEAQRHAQERAHDDVGEEELAAGGQRLAQQVGELQEGADNMKACEVCAR